MHGCHYQNRIRKKGVKMNDLISRQTLCDFALNQKDKSITPNDIMRFPSAQPEQNYCKDCRKHNVKVGFDENFHTVWKEDACPLVLYRGKAQGHEFDYQYCAFAERRTDD